MKVKDRNREEKKENKKDIQYFSTSTVIQTNIDVQAESDSILFTQRNGI